MPTNELIAQAMRLINGKKRDAGGGTNATAQIANSRSGGVNTAGLIASQQLADESVNGGSRNGNGDIYAADYPGLTFDAIARGNSPAPVTPQQQPSATTTPNTPAVPTGQVGNQGGSGPSINAPPTGNQIANYGTNPSPIPMASPTPFTGNYYNNTLDQTLGTNNPTQSQIFGFNYPQNLPAPKAQPVGPGLLRDEINGLYGFGGGSQMGTGTFQSGGAIIMDALNRARKASRGSKGKR